MLRRRFLAVSSTSALAGFAQDRAARLLVSAAGADAIRARFAKIGPEGDALRNIAGKALNAGPWSVTYARPEGQDLTPHDYFSEGPYWWPDPKNPKGPYIRRDGERNPSLFTANHNDLGAMSSALLALGMGALILGDKQYAQSAAEIASVWFLGPKTRMNPNLEHGQSIRGRTSGRGTGIIDTVSLIWAVQGLELLDAAGMLDPRLAAGLRTWFADYLKWMTQSEKGRHEQKSGNNHATWWAAQAAAYAVFTGNTAIQDEIWNEFRTYLVPHQIRPDGSCPLEEARTRSLSYSAFNLDAFSVLCRIAQVRGVDLWRFRGPEGAGVLTAVEYLMPYVQHPDTWRKQQITPFEPGRILFPAFAALGAGSETLLDRYRGLPRTLRSPSVLWADLIVRSR